MKITKHEIWRLEVPMGRTIGDANCSYDSFECVVVALRTDDGATGWGYGVTCSKGVFTRPAFYIQAMPPLSALRDEFERTSWAELRNVSIVDVFEKRRLGRSQHSYVNEAVNTALWDLSGQAVDQPIYRMLGGTRDRVMAYGSPLDFPLSESEAKQRSRAFVDRGFRAIKVKVGAPDVERDIRRLQAIREAVGPSVELTADANTMWTWQETVARIAAYEARGIKLGYIEDPLPFDDVEGYAHLAMELDLDVVGHDYAPTPADLKKLLDVGGIQRIHLKQDFDDDIEYARLARQYGATLIGGNSPFEIAVHAACAFPETDRTEFSDLGWNRLVRNPVTFENGFAIAPQRPGHGLDPIPERLAEFSRPEI